MSHVIGLRCKECGKARAKELLRGVRRVLGRARAGLRPRPRAADVHARRRSPTRPRDLWRYRELLPIDGEPTVGRGTGFTPLLPGAAPGRAARHRRPLDQVRRRLPSRRSPSRTGWSRWR